MEEKIEHVFEVRIQWTEYCLRKISVGNLHLACEAQILRELRLLQQTPHHLNLAELVGVRDAGEEKIDGIFLRYIYGKPLAKVHQAT